MIEERKIVCVVCPQGCEMKAQIGPTGCPRIAGSGCSRGADYAKMELTYPRRVLTTTVACNHGAIPLVPVRSRDAMPREKLLACMSSLAGVTLTAPVKAGDVVVKNILGTGVDIIATRTVPTSDGR